MATITGSKRLLDISANAMAASNSMTYGGLNVATEQYVSTQIANLVSSAPGTLDTLNELAAALGDDPNFATTITTSIGTKLDKTHDMTLTLNGDASGSATFTNMGNATLTVVVANDSHTHDGRYYTESEIDTKLAGKLSTTGKAADSNLLDGINSTSFLRSDANDTASGTYTFSGKVTFSNNVVITESAPTISFLDTDSEDDFYIHVNSNNFYVLRNTNNAENVVDGNWDAPHPLQLEGDTNKAYIFGNLVGSAAYASTSDFDAAGSAGAVEGRLTTKIEEEILPAIPSVPTNVSAFTNDVGYITDGNTGWNNSYGFITNNISTGITINGSLSRGTYTTVSQYHTGADNIVLKGNSVGISGIFFESEKDGTNINHPSDFGFIQYHSYGTSTSGESNELVIGVSNDADDHLVFNAPNTNGMKFRIGANATDYTVYHSGNLSLATLGYTGATNANYITNNNQLTNGAGYITGVDWKDVTGKPTTFSPSAHSHGLSEIDGLEPKLDAALVDASVSNDTITFTKGDGGTFAISTSDANTWRPIDDTPVNGATTESISSNWAYDHANATNPHGITLGALGYTGATNANYITNNNQLTNGAGYVTSSGNTIIGTDSDINTSGYDIIDNLYMTDGVITSHGTRQLHNIRIQDTRAAEKTPDDYLDYAVSFDFTDRIVSGWHSVMTLQGWHDGYAAWQMIGPSNSSTHENWYLRSGVNTTWGSLRKIWHDGNFNPASYLTTSGKAADSNLLDGINSTQFLRSDADDTHSGTLALTSITAASGTITNTKGSYLHLGSWGKGRTDAGAVLVNTAYRSDILSTTRSFTIGNTARNFNGSANVSWTLAEIGAEVAGAAGAVNNRIDDEIKPLAEQGATAHGWGNHASAGYLKSVTWNDVTSKPSTFTPSAHTQAWSTITGTPTTLAGYGITDGGGGGGGPIYDEPDTDFYASGNVTIEAVGDIAQGYYSYPGIRINNPDNPYGYIAEYGMASMLIENKNPNSKYEVRIERYPNGNGEIEFITESDTHGWFSALRPQEIISEGSVYGMHFQTKIQSNGSFFIFQDFGATSLTYDAWSGNLAISGNLNVGGEVTARNVSDRKLKENITPISNAVDKVKAIGGVEFDWNEISKDYTAKTGSDVGVIAQDVQAVYPIATEEVDRESGDKILSHLAVDYVKLVPLALQAIKELSETVDLLKEEIQQLKTNN